MKQFIQKLRRLIRGQPAEPHNTKPYFCVTMLLRMKAEKREQEIAARKAEKAESKYTPAS